MAGSKLRLLALIQAMHRSDVCDMCKNVHWACASCVLCSCDGVLRVRRCVSLRKPWRRCGHGIRCSCGGVDDGWRGWDRCLWGCGWDQRLAGALLSCERGMSPQGGCAASAWFGCGVQGGVCSSTTGCRLVRGILSLWAWLG